jgi:uncharacterized RDD family membrane protein YckC
LTLVETANDTVGFFPRLAAGLIDLVILLPAQIAAWWLVVALATSGPIFVTPLILNAGYFTLAWQYWDGATPGKKIMGLKIVDASTNARAGREAYLRRWAGMWCSLLFLGYGFARIVSDPRHEALHDKWAGTKVVRAR